MDLLREPETNHEKTGEGTAYKKCYCVSHSTFSISLKSKFNLIY